MVRIGNITIYFNRFMALALVVLVLLFFFPLRTEIEGFQLINPFIKERLVAISIVFLVLRSIIHEYYATNLALLFLVMLFLSATFSFAYLVAFTFVSIAFLKFMKRM